MTDRHGTKNVGTLHTAEIEDSYDYIFSGVGSSKILVSSQQVVEVHHLHKFLHSTPSIQSFYTGLCFSLFDLGLVSTLMLLFLILLSWAAQDFPKGVNILINPSRDNIKQGDMVTLTCQYNSTYPAVSGYTWYKNNKVFSTEPIVSFPSITRHDFGDFQCEVQNPVGTGASEVTRLIVFSASTLINPSSEVREGETVTMTCDVPGADPEQIHYSWYKNSIWIKDGASRSLIFYEASASDARYYNCKVQNDKGSDSSPPVILNVLLARILVTPSTEVLESEKVVLTCDLTKTQLEGTVYIWYKNSKRLRESSEKTLVFDEIKSNDSGYYHCKAHSSQDSIISPSVSLHVASSGILISPSSLVQEGMTVNLTCLVATNALGEVKYNWFKNGKEHPRGSTKTLLFGRVSGEDAGLYYCTVQSDKATKASPAINLNVTYAPRNAYIKSFVEIQNGKVAIIQCGVDSNPPSQLDLMKEHQPVASSGNSGLYLQRYNPYFSPNTLRLEIKDLMPSDEGTYIFTAKNVHGTTLVSSHLTVEGARVLVSPYPKLNEGQLATLTCNVLNTPQPVTSYTWYKNGRWFQEGLPGSLVFEQLLSSDAGSYACTGNTANGTRPSSPVSLYVQYPPRNLSLSSFLETQGKRQGVITCSVESQPPSDLLLYKGDQITASSVPLNANKRVRLSISHNAVRLEMYEVALEDQGDYTCRATNSLGASQTSVHFSLQAKVVVTPSAELWEGGSATLTCQIASSAAQNSSFTWYKNNQWLKDGAEASLVLMKVSKADVGLYHCLAKYGSQESISSPVAVTVLYAPKNLQVTSFLEPQRKDQGIILCKVYSVLPSVITLHREGTLLASTTPVQPDQGHKFWSFSSHNYLKLEIRDVTSEDSGRYVCTANNTIGSATTSVSFTTNDKEVLVYKVTAGATLLCVVILVATIIAMCRRKKVWYTKQTDKNCIEMDNNGTTKVHCVFHHLFTYLSVLLGLANSKDVLLLCYFLCKNREWGTCW
ncbi:sialoadhesin [Xenopus laevis]|uniref:Sialoadhesin n=1 Tax=Xenopus laevis TaxID=8355 RepID=A0A8J1LX03_XENLA|nr:sialoadhesin [Xenopus laevis]